MSEAERVPSVFESAKVVSVRPGDVVLFRCPRNLTAPERIQAGIVLDQVFPGHETMILDGGQDIAVLRSKPGFIARLFGKR